MKNFLAITLGTRDIQISLSALAANEWQFDPENKIISHDTISGLSFQVYLQQAFPDTCCFSSPRMAGEAIVKHYKEVLPILHFPLLQPVVDFLLEKNIAISYLFLLCTNQQTEYEQGVVKPKDYNNDTIYFAEIVAIYLQQYLQLQPNQVETFEVTKGVTDMDYLYKHFAGEQSPFFNFDANSIDKIYLLPQGGIDHINQSFTLKLIQQFGEKVMQLQQAEGAAPKQLNFPRLFLNDLYRQRRLQHLNDLAFGLLAENIPKGYKPLKVPRLLSIWCSEKLQLEFSQLLQYLIPLKEHLDSETFEWLEHESTDNALGRLQALLVMVRIRLQQKQYSDMLWRLFTLSENLYKYLAENAMQWRDTGALYQRDYSKENSAWVELLGTELAEWLRSRNIYLTNPNRRAYQAIYMRILDTDDASDQHTIELHQRVIDGLEAASGLRNKIAHELHAVNKIRIDKALRDTSLDLDSLLNDIALVLDVPEYDFAKRTRDLIIPYL